MGELTWIIGGGVIMSAVAMAGAVSILMRPATLERLLLPMVALAAGTLLGGAFFHMIPEGGAGLDPLTASAWVVAGFTVFLALEQFLSWHHSHRPEVAERRPYTLLILVGDALHNFLGGVGIAGTFLLDHRAGIMAFIAAVAHEIPQELGDFGALVHGGWRRSRALLWNFISALTFPLGALVAWFAASALDLRILVLFGAGNFIYIAASDLIPEIKAETGPGSGALHFACFAAGMGVMFLLACALGA